MGNIPEELIKKIENNVKKIGNDLRAFHANKDGNYLIERDKCISIGHIFSWTQSFFVGMALWAYLDSNNKELLEWAKTFEQEYKSKVFDTPMETMHDVGFLYSVCSYALLNYR